MAARLIARRQLNRSKHRTAPRLGASAAHAQDAGMRFLPAAAIALLVLAAVAAPASHADDVTIYRCIDARGHLTLRDTPCASGEKQQTRNMVRPKDPSARPVTAPEAQPERYDAPPPQIVMIAPARPLYECITPDGKRYPSDSGEGNPRWVPLWTLDYPMVPVRHGVVAGGDLAITHGSVHIDGGHTTMTPPVPVPQYAYGAGTWIRDQCYELPPQEVCARLRDRRDEIRTRFFNAMPSERDVLRVEERGVNARLDNDCGGH
jgi:hypothetical protein